LERAVALALALRYRALAVLEIDGPSALRRAQLEQEDLLDLTREIRVPLDVIANDRKRFAARRRPSRLALSRGRGGGRLLLDRLRDLLVELDRRVRDDGLVPLLHLAAEDDLVPVFPHLGHQRLTGEHA